MKRVSLSTVHRLSLYYRSLCRLEEKGVETTSSKELAKQEKLTPAQVRKDLSFFGSFGTRGLGYPIKQLKEKIAAILGIDREWNVALVGVGNVGSSLVSYKEFAKQGFNIKLIFDNDQRKINKYHKGILVSDIKELGSKLVENNIDIVVIAVPASAAQKITDQVAQAGVKAILNFAPTNVVVPDGVIFRSVNMAIELEHLSFASINRTSFKI